MPAQSLPPDWNQALELAQANAVDVKEGMTARAFAELIGVHPNTVRKVARQGIEKFKEKFGPGCDFEQGTLSDGRSEWHFTFAGKLNAMADHLPVPGALRTPEFYKHLQLTISWRALYSYHLKGHAWFREKFPGWDFMEVPRPGTDQVVCWYVPVAVAGEQPDILPEDELTVAQFAQLKGLRAVSALQNNCYVLGVEWLEKRYPGWSFRQDKGKRIYFRIGPERVCFNQKEFAAHMAVSPVYVRQCFEAKKFEEEFPGWQVRQFIKPGGKLPTWMISQVPTEPTEPLTVSVPAAVTETAVDWLDALVRAQSQVVHCYQGLATAEFSRLVNFSAANIRKVIGAGETVFKQKFGDGCSFEKVASPMRPFRYQFSFMGRVHPVALVVPGVRLVTEQDVAQEQGYSLAQLKEIAARGHGEVRKCFSGWDFIDLEDPFRGGKVRLFMKAMPGLKQKA